MERLSKAKQFLNKHLLKIELKFATRKSQNAWSRFGQESGLVVNLQDFKRLRDALTRRYTLELRKTEDIEASGLLEEELNYLKKAKDLSSPEGIEGALDWLYFQRDLMDMYALEPYGANMQELRSSIVSDNAPEEYLDIQGIKHPPEGYRRFVVCNRAIETFRVIHAIPQKLLQEAADANKRFILK